ncbi:methylthioribulose 1-phosphate dehydratase [Micromonospora sp. KC606]|uniref:methylthioribulose 1-phosphate dehydratase n=1 Tax=Micromonospora sp. KC606 TaxID=2530379 RepID=UPI00104D42B2|nr:methylthioribulose 1-phosphate dehydratase [Micromonospora sp. KC606]TDC82866.1 methylthioribulose 1-phosphate dehydratase [Micromonospora sp. KC606]
MQRQVESVTDAPHPVDAANGLSVMARHLYDLGWMPGTSGNVSVRFDQDLVLITASGLGKGRLTAADTVLVRADTGEPVRPGAARPSAETSIHLALYRAFPAVGAVVHAHPPYATALASRTARAGGALVRFSDLELIKGLGRSDVDSIDIPLFTNWRDVPRIAADVGDHFSHPVADPASALLIAHHGATAWGADLAQASDRLECLEALCQLALLVGD